MMETLFSFSLLDEQRYIVSYLDSVQARLVLLRELQPTAGEELSALLQSALDWTFKGELWMSSPKSKIKIRSKLLY